MRLLSWTCAFALACAACGGAEPAKIEDDGASSGGSSSTQAMGSGGGSQTVTSGAGGHSGGACPAPPPGVQVGFAEGQQLPELWVKRCDGSDVSLDAFCGAEATWIFAMHVWCPLCQSVSSKAEAIHDAHAPDGLTTLLVVVEDASGNPPTAELCQTVRAEHAHEDVVTLYDPTGSVLALWGGSSSLSAFLDADRVITGKLVHDSDPSHIETGIAEALAP